MTEAIRNRDVVIGTRGSRLALWQANHVSEQLSKAGLGTRLEIISTKGDQDQSTPLPEIGDKGLFTAELDRALLEGKIDLAVHSLKDLPTVLPDGLVLAAVPERASSCDAVVARDASAKNLSDIPSGSRIGSSSLRRGAQLLAARPDLVLQPLRGNVETRLRKLDEGLYDAIILAEAGLARLGLADRISFRLTPGVMTPAVGQGALGIVCAEASESCSAVRLVLNDAWTEWLVLAERAFLRRLEGGCQIPVGGLAVRDQDDLLLTGCVAAVDGSVVYRGEMTGRVDEAEGLGERLAQQLIDQGAGSILEELKNRSS